MRKLTWVLAGYTCNLEMLSCFCFIYNDTRHDADAAREYGWDQPAVIKVAVFCDFGFSVYLYVNYF